MSVFLFLEFASLSPLGAEASREGLGPLLCLLLWQEWCFFEFLDLSFCWTTKALMDVPAVLINPIFTSLSCS
jgi:hypothetical protein